MSGKTGLRLRFKRWLSVEKGIYDQAALYLNNAQLYANPSGTDVIDQEWKPQDSTSPRWPTTTPRCSSVRADLDRGLEFGGWNIDDVQLVTLGPVTGGPFSRVRHGHAGTGGVPPHLAAAGRPRRAATVTLTLTGAKPNAIGMAFFGTDAGHPAGLRRHLPRGQRLRHRADPDQRRGGFTLNGNLPSVASIVGLTCASSTGASIRWAGGQGREQRAAVHDPVGALRR
jgi:hypothetical protein